MDIFLNSFTAASADDMIELGTKLSEFAAPGMVIALTGSLGAGKTTLVKGIASGLGIKVSITSPSFTIINEYTEGRIPLYHMDLYRIDSIEELELIGAEEILYGSGLSVIEWSEKAGEILPPETVAINIIIGDKGVRTIKINGLNK